MVDSRPRRSVAVGRWPIAAHPLIGFLALFSGIALLLNILAELSLPIALAATSVAVVIALSRLLRKSTPRDRAAIAATLATGAIAGVVATLTYDAAKAALSLADPSPYNPFEAVRVFGTLLIGQAAPPLAVIAAGASFHILNGTCFGIAYTFLLGARARALRSNRFALASGMGWGLFLETFQLTLYPGWLDIRLYQEFATISALSHLVYGGTLALVARYLLLRRPDAERHSPRSSPIATGGGTA